MERVKKKKIKKDGVNGSATSNTGMLKISSFKISSFSMMAFGFAFGCFVSVVIMLNIKSNVELGAVHKVYHPLKTKDEFITNTDVREIGYEQNDNSDVVAVADSSSTNSRREITESPPRKNNDDDADVDSFNTNVRNELSDQRIIIAITAFDFSQIPHLEEELDSYHDLCLCGAKRVDIFIHATVAYPVTLIDLLNTRFICENFSITIVLKPSSLKLYLVDCHRALFYDKINDYDLFIYTEDDMRVRPTLVASYLRETRRIDTIITNYNKNNKENKYKPSDFNVGVVRYEYNYPSNVVIDDKTRHATVNVTRVYWEHSSALPAEKMPETDDLTKMASSVEQEPQFYVHMKNHHQGMFLATQKLLLEWKNRGKSCDFSNARSRPGKGGQPSEGTQRVWMSSQMLYGKRHCGVQQTIPLNHFGTLTIHHLPNKNYRRVGKYRTREFSDGTESFVVPPKLETAMDLHIRLRTEYPMATKKGRPYQGAITMIDEVNRQRSTLLERRMEEYRAYVARGGILSEDDLTKTKLIETS